MQRAVRFACLLLTLMLCLPGAVACAPSSPSQDTEPDTSDTAEPESSAPESASDAQTTEDSVATEEPETQPPETSAPESESETTAETEPVSSSVEEEPETPEFVNPLTGLVAEKDWSGTRPAAIMINNIQVSCPQVGVSRADVMYECLVEGGYTRLMMLVMDYASLPEVGSVRSSRDYYLDFAADYDAIYVHAGGSQYAYQAISDRKVNNLDGVNMYLPTTFYRDQNRISTMGLEHSLMTTGKKIAEGVAYKKYRTELSEDFDYPLDFVRYGTTVSFDDAALHIRIPYSLAQTTDFVYDEESASYLRYQFDGVKHIDGATGEQLTFENVLILFCETGLITGDPYRRIEVGTVGEGKGYYATEGTYIPITWKKEAHETPVQFFDEDGEPLLINAGKTFVSVCPTSIQSLISFNYTK